MDRRGTGGDPSAPATIMRRVVARLWQAQQRTSEDWLGEGFAVLIGHARSGTTVLARAIGSHPEVGYWEEPALLTRIDTKFNWLEQLARHLVADAGVSDLSRTHRDGNLREQFADELDVNEREVEGVRLRAIRSLVESLRSDFLQRSGGSVLLEKTPREITVADRIARWFPRAKVIHIVRDGRDVVCSGLTWEQRWGRPPWVPKEGELLDVIARQWAEQVGQALKATSDQVLLVRYEDLATDGRAVVAACIDHLGLDWHPDIDRFLATGMGGIHDASVGRWREELDASQRARVEEHATETLAAAGYLD